MSDFQLEVLSPTKAHAKVSVSEVVLPAYDGEMGILAQHEDFVGQLGTGPLKYVQQGNDHWLMVSSGIFTVKNGELSILAEVIENASDVKVDVTKQRIAEIEPQLHGKSFFDPEHERLEKEHARLKARLEVFRRTNEVN